MAGYSGTPLVKKLGIKDGYRVLLRNAPARLPEELGEYRKRRFEKNLDLVVLFAETFAGFKGEFAKLMHAIHRDGTIWVAWPKKSSGIASDLSEDAIRNHALTTSFVDVKVCAIDDTWSGLKLVIRKQLRTPVASGTH